ncbi:MAG: SDR family NAD(P)-dependent oxidoreductase [Clostridia bacterium]|nr:SDR family NAD(P)-dependent oxidoreductase [Clostridia bacterium]
MSKAAQLVLENTVSGKIDVKVGAELLKVLKQDDSKKVHEDIAIIGVSVNFPMSGSVEDFWNNLKTGRDCTGEFPESRKEDVTPFLEYGGIDTKGAEYSGGGYLSEIDKFDYSFFKLSPKEADLMDPCQRLFLETAWSAIEDSGYGGNKLVGSRTGVYVGYNGWPMYGQIASKIDPLSASISTAGNVSAIIPSRIAYLMDFHGPSMIVDTACSSSLLAVHLACQGIKNGECETAIAGGVKVNLAPVKGSGSIGIESPDYKAKAFDDSADGTAWGEGVAAIVLKPLSKALKDRDNIYAVIKGSAVNQDGNSIGITAPNVAAQEDVIVRAWKDSGIEPETISYIEAHGTGTKLGDPIEVEGIQRAFRKFTDKKQFCGIGSVKSNIGHLDNAAGISSFIKAALALKHGEIPPSIHFKQPNQKIDFENSPVYVNAELKKWVKGDSPRRCGVSAFGLSGTNCHIVLEEAPEIHPEERLSDANIQVLALSSKSEEALVNLIGEYSELLNRETVPTLEDICYTANTGRGHYEYRIAFLIKDTQSLKDKLEKIRLNGLKSIDNEGIYFSAHKVVTKDRKEKESGYITEEEKRQLSIEAAAKLQEATEAQDGKNERLNELCLLYVKGAEVEWDSLYDGEKHRRVSLPAYPFERKRCWVQIQDSKEEKDSKVHIKEINHPLLDRCAIRSLEQDIYVTEFQVDRHWVLSDHVILGSYTIPGTTYLEMARELGSRIYSGSIVELRNILYLSPLVVNESETREAHTIVKKKKDYCEFIVASRMTREEPEAEEIWIKHAEGEIHCIEMEAQPQYDLDQLKAKCERKGLEEYGGITNHSIEFGAHWTEIKLSELYTASNESLIGFEFPDRFESELKEYVLHPSLMDATVTIGGALTGNNLYLPLSYRKIRTYGPIPKKLYSYISVKDVVKEGMETVPFDVSLLDENGKVMVDIENFVLKRVHEAQHKFDRLSGHRDIYYHTSWKHYPLKEKREDLPEGSVLIFKDETGIGQEIKLALEGRGKDVIIVELGTSYQKKGEGSYIVGGSEEDYDRLMADISQKKLSQVLHLCSIGGRENADSLGELEQSLKTGVYSLFYITRSIINNKLKGDMEIVLISDYISEVTGKEGPLIPHNATLLGLGKVIGFEYPQLKCRCIDIDSTTQAAEIISELYAQEATYQIAYRNGERYVEEFGELDVRSLDVKEVAVKCDGAYVITGGLGGIGLETAKYLASRNKVNLAFINRSRMPERSEWTAILEAKKDEKLCKKIKEIQEIEAAGAQITCYSADVSSYDEMKQILNTIRQTYGRINGIIHGAGIAGDGFIIRKEEAVFRSVMLPKVQGTWILDSLTKQDDMDFMVLFSSVSSVFGVTGQGDYTAANSYLDAVAALRSKRGKRTLAINWPAWKETGMAVDYGVNHDTGIFKTIATAQAIGAFDEIIGRDTARVILGELNYKVIDSMDFSMPVHLSEKIKKALGRQKQQGSKEATVRNENKANEVILKGKSGGDYNDVEMTLGRIWGEILGLKEIDIYDNFYHLGGDSILATQLLKKLDGDFPGMLEIADVFTYSTINRMSEYMLSKTKKVVEVKEENHGSEEDDLDRLLAQLETGEISVDEAEKLMSNGG